ncbi:MAG: isoprenylcysteine carboxylmethyltransferase family protein [Anaerolineales bacterium]|jgi:protein-S-isoprenylcysteine O-methyltransferase Ste14
MSKCRVRLIYWLVLVFVSVGGGVAVDVALKTQAFPWWLRLLGLAGMLLARYPLQRTGRILKDRGEAEEWGCTTHLVTDDIYQCVRHPHHLGVGIFMTGLGLLIGHIWSFLFITVAQWAWVLAFLLIVEEPELAEKFGEAYNVYRRRVPMLLVNPRCLARIMSQPLDRGES